MTPRGHAERLLLRVVDQDRSAVIDGPSIKINDWGRNYRMKSFALFIAGSVVAVVLSACSPKINPTALGKWRLEGRNETMEFRGDGTCQGMDQYGRVVSGKFAFLSPNEIKLDLTTSSEDKAKGLRFVDHSVGVASFVVNGDELVMTEQHGSRIHYQRQK
jgi:hypothetical protein